MHTPVWFWLCQVGNVRTKKRLSNKNSLTNGYIETELYTGKYAQQWQIVSVGDGYYKLVNRMCGKIISLSQDNRASQEVQFLRITASYLESEDTVFVKIIGSAHSYFKKGDSFVYIRQGNWIWFQKFVNSYGVIKEEYFKFEVGLAHKRFYPTRILKE